MTSLLTLSLEHLADKSVLNFLKHIPLADNTNVHTSDKGYKFLLCRPVMFAKFGLITLNVCKAEQMLPHLADIPVKFTIWASQLVLASSLI